MREHRAPHPRIALNIAATASPTTVTRDPAAFAPTATAPWLDFGNLLPEVPTDRTGAARHAPVDLGPYER